MFYKISKAIILCLFLFNTAHSQAPSIEWQKCYGGPSGESCTCIQPTSDGGSIACGIANTPTAGGDITTIIQGYKNWVIKLDAAGNLVWQKPLPGESATAIQQTTDGGYIFNSSIVIQTANITHLDFLVVKLNNSGDIVWQKNFGGTGNDVPACVRQTADGGYIATGQTNSADGNVTGFHGTIDCWIIKLDGAGNLLWQRALGGSAVDNASDIRQTVDGGYILAGFTSSPDGDVINPSHFIGTGWIVKLDNTGNPVWQKLYGSGGPVSICITNDGGYAFVSDAVPGNNSFPGNHGFEDYSVIKLDAAGNLIWQKMLGGSIWDQPRCIIQSNDGGFIAAGSVQSTDGDVVGNHGAYDSWIVKLAADGTPEWTKAMGGINGDWAWSIFQTPDQGYLVGGSTINNNNGDVGPNHGQGDFWIVKLAPDLLPVNLSNFDAAAKGNDVVCKWKTTQEQNSSHFIIERSNDAEHYVTTGRVEAKRNSTTPVDYNFTDKDILLSKDNYLYYRLKMVDIDGKFSYSSIVKISSHHNVTGIVLMGNPVNGLLKINVTDKSIVNTTAKIINSLGAVVKTAILKEGLQNIDISEIAPGNYFLKTKLASQKFILTK